MVRKKPVRHGVTSHQRRDGSLVRQHQRGSGVRAKRNSRLVGTEGVPDGMLKATTNIEMHAHGDDLIKTFKDLGFSVRPLTGDEIMVAWDVDSEEAEKLVRRQDGFEMDGMFNWFLLSRAGKPVKSVLMSFP